MSAPSISVYPSSHVAEISACASATEALTDPTHDSLVVAEPAPAIPGAISVDIQVKPPFTTIRRLFDRLREASWPIVYFDSEHPLRGLFQIAPTETASDQKYTIDLSPHHTSHGPPHPSATHLDPDVLADMITVRNVLDAIHGTYTRRTLSVLSELAGVDLAAAHRKGNASYRLCDYTAENCDTCQWSQFEYNTHVKYGTFCIIFQDGTGGFEVENPARREEWTPVPGDTAVVLAGWCAFSLSGGKVKVVQRRVRRRPGLRRLCAMVFVAPDETKPLEGGNVVNGASSGVIGMESWSMTSSNVAGAGAERNSSALNRDMEHVVWAEEAWGQVELSHRGRG